MKKIIFLMILCIPFYTFAWDVDFSNEEKNYCILMKNINTINEEVEELSSQINNLSYYHEKFSDIINPYYREPLIEQARNGDKNTLNNLMELWIQNAEKCI